MQWMWKLCTYIILHCEARTLIHAVVLTACLCVRPAGEEIPEVRLCRDGASFCGGAAFVGQPAHGEPGESAGVQRRSGLQTEAQTLLHEQLLPGHGRRGRHPVQVWRGAVVHSGGVIGQTDTGSLLFLGVFPLLFRPNTSFCLNPLLVFSDCDRGGSGSEVCGSEPDRLLHHGGGRRREAADGPGWSLQTTVSSAQTSWCSDTDFLFLLLHVSSGVSLRKLQRQTTETHCYLELSYRCHRFEPCWKHLW